MVFFGKLVQGICWYIDFMCTLVLLIFFDKNMLLGKCWLAGIQFNLNVISKGTHHKAAKHWLSSIQNPCGLCNIHMFVAWSSTINLLVIYTTSFFCFSYLLNTSDLLHPKRMKVQTPARWCPNIGVQPYWAIIEVSTRLIHNLNPMAFLEMPRK